MTEGKEHASMALCPCLYVCTCVMALGLGFSVSLPGCIFFDITMLVIDHMMFSYDCSSCITKPYVLDLYVPVQ